MYFQRQENFIENKVFCCRRFLNYGNVADAAPQRSGKRWPLASFYDDCPR
jgi:hypothetical protein